MASYTIRETDVVHEVIDGEAILINMGTGAYYSLDGSGCRVWEALQQGAVSADSLGIHDTESRAAIQAFFDELVAEGLATTGADEAATAAEGLFETPFSAPTLHKYTDMEALLQIDPIHDVAPEGWPHADVSKE